MTSFDPLIEADPMPQYPWLTAVLWIFLGLGAIYLSATLAWWFYDRRERKRHEQALKRDARQALARRMNWHWHWSHHRDEHD